MLRYCSPCDGSTRDGELSRFRSVPRAFSKQGICFLGRDRYKALGLMSAMGILQQLRKKPTTIA